MSESKSKRIKRTASSGPSRTFKESHFSEKNKIERFKRFELRKLETHKVLDLHWFIENDFEFPHLIVSHFLENFCTLNGNQYPVLVKQFYANMIKGNGSWLTEVKGKRILFGRNTLEEIAGLKNSGITVPDVDNEEWSQFNSVTAYSRCLRQNKRYDGGQMKAGMMKVNDRMLHYLIVYILLPRLFNKAQPNDEDMRYIYALKMGLNINWADVVLCHMVRRFNDPSGALPYPVLVSKIIEHAGVDLSNEVKLNIRDHSDKIDKMTLNKMKIVRRNGIWEWNEDILPDEHQESAENENENTDDQEATHINRPSMEDLIIRMQGMLDVHQDNLQNFVVNQNLQLKTFLEERIANLEERVEFGITQMESLLGNKEKGSSSNCPPPES